MPSVKVKNGVVTFPNTATFNTVIDNKNGEFNRLSKSLKSQNFRSVRQLPHTPNVVAQGAGGPSTFTTSFDSTLYTDFNKDVLNTQKIISVSGFFVKVDMDNDFCSIIDAALPNAYNILAANDLTNPNVHVFVSSDEPVLAVIDALSTGAITWDGYQTELARKGGGICFKKGSDEKRAKAYGNLGPNHRVYMSAEYTKNFLSFQFRYFTFAAANNSPFTLEIQIYYNYTYSYETACGQSNSGGEQSFGIEPQRSFYQGGTALKTVHFTGSCSASYAGYYGSTTVITF